jgi:hypothetical protein
MPKGLADKSKLTVIDTQRTRLKPPETLTKKEREIFSEIVDSSDPRGFRRAELPVLVAYVQAISFSQWYTLKLSEGDSSYHRLWLDATKLVALLASRLRLAPSTRLQPKSVESHRETDPDELPLWERYNT